jgi:type VI secretion system protein
MALRLRVLGTKSERLGDRWSRVFGVHGGSLGRAPDCDWVLPDPERYLSGHHAAIEYRSGHWYVIDRSMNGTFVNGAPHPLGKDRAYALRDGDRLRMGEYDFLVSITPDNDFAPEVEGIGGTYARALDVPPIAPDLLIATHGDLGSDLDVKGLLASPVEPPDDPAPPVRPLPGVSDAYGQAVEVPLPGAKRAAASPVVGVSAPGEAASRAAAPPPRPMHVAEAQTPIAGLGPLQAFCRGAGIDAAKLPEQEASLVLALAGQLLREFALGLMLGLRHRAEQRHALRASATGITPIAQNPFKTARSVEEALQRMFAPRSQRFLAPVDAVRAGFGDLQRHETTTLGAMQDALRDYLEHFAPEGLEEQFERSLSRSSLSAEQVAGKYWEMYGEMYRVLAHVGQDGLPHAFAEQFAEAYARREEEFRTGGKEKTG